MSIARRRSCTCKHCFLRKYVKSCRGSCELPLRCVNAVVCHMRAPVWRGSRGEVATACGVVRCVNRALHRGCVASTFVCVELWCVNAGIQAAACKLASLRAVVFRAARALKRPQMCMHCVKAVLRNLIVRHCCCCQ